MIKSNLFIALMIFYYSSAQIAYTSFEEPQFFPGEYIDTGDATSAHDLINNPNEPMVDYSSTGDEMGFNARYEPYDSPGEGLTDGDEVGVTNEPPSSIFPNGSQGFKISDVDGNFILEFDPVLLSSPTILIDYFIAETGYEGDGTENSSGSDRLRIYVRDLSDNSEYDLLNTTGNDINDLGIEGAWYTASLAIDDSPNISIQLIVEARTNSSSEAFYFDSIFFEEQLGNVESFDDSFKIFPNPVNRDYVYIVSKSEDPIQLCLYNILGEEKLKTVLYDQKLDIRTFSNGIYLLNVTQGNVSFTKKLVINN